MSVFVSPKRAKAVTGLQSLVQPSELANPSPQFLSQEGKEESITAGRTTDLGLLFILENWSH